MQVHLHLVLVEARLDGDGGARGAEVAARARREGDVEVRRREDVALVAPEAVKHQLLKSADGRFFFSVKINVPLIFLFIMSRIRSLSKTAET